MKNESRRETNDKLNLLEMAFDVSLDARKNETGSERRHRMDCKVMGGSSNKIDQTLMGWKVGNKSEN